ncbi:MAG: hypothetical protein WC876_01280 [Candidatus Thermoplasmatota archaeon]|jgi:hypothetical protein
MADPTDPILLLSIIKIITVALGAVFLGITWRAYRRQPNRGILVLFIAVVLMTIAAVAEGLAFQALGLSLDQAHIIEGLFTLAGFAVLVYSVWTYKPK